jgi:hypothetical protein
MLLLCVILTEASERSLRGRTSDSSAQAKPVPVPSLRIQFLCHSRAKRRIPATDAETHIVLHASCVTKNRSVSRAMQFSSQHFPKGADAEPSGPLFFCKK